MQSAADPRPAWRARFTVLGGLALILGAFLPWWDGSRTRGVDQDVDRLGQAFVDQGVNLGGFEQLLTAGCISGYVGGLLARR